MGIYNNNQLEGKEIKEINDLVGAPMDFLKRLKAGGIGSPRLNVERVSPDLTNKFGKNVDQKFINIELRDKGIVIYFRNHFNNYLWAIPYYRLTIYRDGTFNLHSAGMYIRIDVQASRPNSDKFLQKMMHKRAIFLENYAAIT